MGMMESLAQLREEAEAKLKNCQSSEELEQLLVDVLGRNGSLTTILRTMGKLESSERASVGAFANKVKAALETVVAEKRAALSEIAKQRRFAEEALDVTAPGQLANPLGRLHRRHQRAAHHLVTHPADDLGLTRLAGVEHLIDCLDTHASLGVPLNISEITVTARRFCEKHDSEAQVASGRSLP